MIYTTTQDSQYSKFLLFAFDNAEDVHPINGLQVYNNELYNCQLMNQSQVSELIHAWISDVNENDMIGPSFSVSVSQVLNREDKPYEDSDLFVEAAIRDYILSYDSDHPDLIRLKALLFDRCSL